MRAWPFDLDLAHVRDVEDPGVGADRPVLLDHPLVLDGHLPAGERDHPRAECDVAVVERRLLQGLRHAETILVSPLRPAFRTKTGLPRRHPRMGRGSGPGRVG